MWSGMWRRFRRPPGHAGPGRRLQRAAGMVRRISMRVRMLHFSMLLCMAQAEEAVMPPPQYAPYVIAATAAALVIYMIRAKRRRVEWRFRRDDIVVVAVDGEGG